MKTYTYGQIQIVRDALELAQDISEGEINRKIRGAIELLDTPLDAFKEVYRLKDEIERLTAELVDVKAEQLARFEALAKYTVDLEAERDRLKESATEWNHRYIDACQQHNDRRTNLGHQIVALGAERDALKAALQLIKANTNTLDWPDDINAAIQGAGK